MPAGELGGELNLNINRDEAPTAWLDALDRGLGAPASATGVATSPAAISAAASPSSISGGLELEPTLPPPSFRGEPALPLFSTSATDDEPPIRVPLAPRPLSVRRTPDTRLRSVHKPVVRPSEPQLDFADEQEPPSVPVPAGTGRVQVVPEHLETSGPARRLIAAAIDQGILLVIDVVVVYLTLRIASLTMDDWRALPILPMAAFLGLVKLSYFSAFTCVGGQTIGKMAANIRVIGDDDRPLDAAHAVHRTLAGAVSCLILGAGFVPALFGSDRRALHDRLAHTRVVMLPAA